MMRSLAYWLWQSGLDARSLREAVARKSAAQIEGAGSPVRRGRESSELPPGSPPHGSAPTREPEGAVRAVRELGKMPDPKARQVLGGNNENPSVGASIHHAYKEPSPVSRPVLRVSDGKGMRVAMPHGFPRPAARSPLLLSVVHSPIVP